MQSKILIFLFVVSIAALGTFGFGLMGHASQHMCPVVEFLGYSCPLAAGADFSAHHLSTFQTFSRVTAESGASVFLALLLWALSVAVAIVFARDFATDYFYERKATFQEQAESVVISRQPFFRWLALRAIRDSRAFWGA